MRSKVSVIGLVACLGLVIPACSCAAPAQTPATQTAQITHGTTATRYVEVPPALAGTYIMNSIKTEPGRIELETDFPECPWEIMVYERVLPDITDDYVRDLASRLGFIDEYPLTGGEREVYTYTGGDDSLEISMTGRLSLRVSQDIATVPDLPSDDECIRIATEWLEHNGLYPEQVTRVEIGYGGKSVMTVNAETGETGDTVYYSKSVKFITSCNGYQTPSTDAYVLVGDGGKIVRADIDLATCQEYGLVRLMTPREAFEILEEYQARLTPVVEDEPRCIFRGSAGPVVVNSVTIEYWGTQRSNLLLPVYVFRGRTDSVMEEEFTGYVDAVRR